MENRLLWVDAVEILRVTILANEASSLGTDAEEDDAALLVESEIDLDRVDSSLR